MDPRSRTRLAAAVVATLACTLACDGGGTPAPSETPEPPVTPPGTLRAPAPARGLVHLPVRFEENRGQAGEGVRFLAQAAGYAAWVADDAIGFATAGSGGWQSAVAPATLLMSWGGADGTRARAVDPRPTVVGYAEGAAARNAIEGVSTFGAVEVADVAPGVRLRFGDDAGRVGVRIHAESGDALKGLTLRFSGVGAAEADGAGGLVFRGRQGMARVSAPTTGAFAIDDDGGVHVEVDPGAEGPLEVAARFEVSNFVGGTPDESLRKGASLPSVAVGPDGRVYLAGDSVEPRPPFGAPGPYAGGRNGFVACIDLGGDAPEVLWVRHVGDSGHDGVSGIAAGPDGQVFAAGWSQSLEAFAGLEPDAHEWGETRNAINFVLALDGTTSQVLGARVLTLGSLGVFGPRVVFDASQLEAPVIVAGNATVAPGFPDEVLRGTEGVVGAAPIGGGDGYVAALDPGLSGFAWFTYLGGTGGEVVLGVAAGDGAVYVAGGTDSQDFPAGGTPPDCERLPCAAFVARLSAAGERLDTVEHLGPVTDASEEAVALASVATSADGGLAMRWTSTSAEQRIAPAAAEEAPRWEASVPAGSGPAIAAVGASVLAGSASDGGIALVAVNGGSPRELWSAPLAAQLVQIAVTPGGRALVAGVHLGEPGPGAPETPAPVPGDAYFLVEVEAPGS